MNADLKTLALVLKRTNYGETDRILNLLTPSGKISVLAKGVRKEKSRLASGVEMFSLSELVIHQGKSEFGILTSAKPKEFYQGILSDFARLQTASEIIKSVSRVAEQVNAEEFFSVTVQALRAINKGGNLEIILAWFYLNIAKISGEQINLYNDSEGKPLAADESYAWNVADEALRASSAGKISGPEIKMMRLMLSAELSLVLKVKNTAKMAPELLYIAKSVNQL
ncbi:DNA repair protein RecO [Candidatus Saccharibacteria bacterium]|nr:DNA repair protein RecO [Candidatus Saccharibacteria bacterium]